MDLDVRNMTGARANDYIRLAPSRQEANESIIGAIIRAYITKAGKPHIVVSAAGPSSIVRYCEYMQRAKLIELSYVSPLSNGTVDPNMITHFIKDNTALVCVEYVNEITGVINNIVEIGSAAHSKDIPLHCDITNIFGIARLNILRKNIDSCTMSLANMGCMVIRRELIDGYKVRLPEEPTSEAWQNLFADELKKLVKMRSSRSKLLIRMRQTITTNILKTCASGKANDYLRNKRTKPPPEGTMVLLSSGATVVPHMLALSIIKEGFSSRKINIQNIQCLADSPTLHKMGFNSKLMEGAFCIHISYDLKIQEFKIMVKALIEAIG